MDCERTQGLLSDYLDGSLPESDLAEVTAHLRKCRPCSAEAEGLRETVALLRDLPLLKAPAQLSEGVRRGIASGEALRPLWKKMFLPAHVKIPLEAAAAILVFLLVYTANRNESPISAPPPPPAAQMEKPTPAPSANTVEADTPSRAAKRKAVEPAPRFAVLPPRQEPARETATEPKPKSALPSVPAQFVSTGGGQIEPAGTAGEATTVEGPRPFGAPPSRLLRPGPYGRDVTLVVTGENLAGLEERIADAARRTGGAVVREQPRQAAPENAAPAARVRVHVPSQSAEAFLAELSRLGTIPPEGMPGGADFPAGPSPGVAAYTVRIRVK